MDKAGLAGKTKPGTRLFRLYAMLGAFCQGMMISPWQLQNQLVLLNRLDPDNEIFQSSSGQGLEYIWIRWRQQPPSVLLDLQ